MTGKVTVSHHLLRRTARRKAARLNEEPKLARSGFHYEVEKAQRGPWRWRVVETYVQHGV